MMKILTEGLKLDSLLSISKKRRSVPAKVNIFVWISTLLHTKATSFASNTFKKKNKKRGAKSSFSLTIKELFASIAAKSVLLKDFQILVQVASLY